MRKVLVMSMLFLMSFGLIFGADVTFEVNMSAQIENGTFDPASDSVDVAGTFNGWGGTLNYLSDADGDSVYNTTVTITAPDTIEYKYRLNGSWDVAESISNRVAVITGDTTLTSWWNDYNPNAIIDAEIYFSVDMRIQLMNGNFQPDSGDITVIRGAFNGWSGEDDQLTEDPATDGLYTYSKEMDSLALGAANEYKFVIVPGEGSDMWESIDNRSFTIPMDHDLEDTDGDGYVEFALDTVFFNNVGMEDIVGQDVNVYFTVDISSAINALEAGEVLIDSQTDADTISSVDEIDAVYVNGLKGQWWDWGSNPEDYKMYDDGTHGDETAGDNIYTRGILYTAGQAKEVTYKYGINSLDNEAGFAENRSLTIDDSESTFDPETDCFGEQNTDDRLPFPEYTCGEPTTDVTFQVNMSAQVENGTFDPATDSVDVAGTFNGWGSTLNYLSDEDGDSIYTTTVEMDTGMIEYKYRLNGSWDVAESISNRTYVVVQGHNEIPVVWWNDFNPNAIVDAEIYFSVDMRIQLMNGNFQPDSGDITVIRGAFNGWAGEDDQLTEDPAQDGLYTYSKEIDSLALGAGHEYKFVIVPGEGSDMWESIDNRSFTIPMDHDLEDTDGDGYVEFALDTVFFNNVGMEDIVSQDVNVYFTVDISSAINALEAGEVLIDSQTDADTISSVDEIDAVYINGLFGQWWDWGSNPEDYKMYDDGTHGDETAGDNIYTRGILYTAGQAKEVTYKYGINSLDNEAGFAENRTMTIDDSESTFDPETDCFGSQNTDDRLPFPEYTCDGVDVEDGLAGIPEEYILYDNYPNPFNPTTTIMFAMPEAAKATIEIYNILGQKVKTLYADNLKAGIHTVQWDATDSHGNQVSAGVYIYRLSTNNVSKTKKMILLK
jgi:hypothetical protein